MSEQKMQGKELKYLGMLFLYLIVLFKITFFHESLMFLVMFVSKLMGLFVLPGYVLMLHQRQMKFVERLLIGFGLNLAALILMSYLFGFVGLPLRFHLIVIPLIVVAVGIFQYRRTR